MSDDVLQLVVRSLTYLLFHDFGLQVYVGRRAHGTITGVESGTYPGPTQMFR